MGIRIHKNIGYYLPKKNVKNILVKNYQDILDEFDLLDKAIFEKMSIEMTQFTKEFDHISFIYPQIQLNEFIKDNVELNILQFISTVYDYDTFKGVLFLTPELAKESRYDNLIDYYENNGTPVFKLKLLKQPIYPDNYYFCTKVPELTKNALEVFAQENPKKPILEVGDIISSDKLRYLMIYNKADYKNQTNAWAYPKDMSEKYFHPYVNIITYICAKTLGILKPEVSYCDFAKQLEPAIINSWG